MACSPLGPSGQVETTLLIQNFKNGNFGPAKKIFGQNHEIRQIYRHFDTFEGNFLIASKLGGF